MTPVARALAGLALLCGGPAQTLAQALPPATVAPRPEQATPVPPPSSAAERVYAAARGQLLQVRTLLSEASEQSSIGSAFLVGADSFAITNYHVVSQYALDPSLYRLEYAAADGTRGELKLLAIDLPNDLAVVRLESAPDAAKPRPHFQFDARALAGTLPQGERLYSMGNPLDLGFSIVEGTYNGSVERSYNERILFSGAVNPGMSGGPTVAADGKVAGINVAKRTDGELVSFLVPARFAAKLLEKARVDIAAGRAMQPRDIVTEIGRQLAERQSALYKQLDESGFRPGTFGPYRASEVSAPWFTCWAQTNATQSPKPRAEVNTKNCASDTRLFVAGDLNVGLVQLTHSYIRSSELNPFQFATFLSRQNQIGWTGNAASKWYTRQRCHEDFVAAGEDRPPIRAVWCARAYRKFDDLYDVWVSAVTQDRDTEALSSRLILQSVTFDNAARLTKRFLEDVRWAK